MSVFFLHSKCADNMAHCNKHIPIIGGDFNAELGPGKGTESKSVRGYTLYESYKRGDWLKSWLMLHDYSALNAMFRKTPQKQTSFVSPKGKEKQIDHILTKRRYLRHVKDAEANDMIHMGSDHRCVTTTFMINMLGKDIHTKIEKTKHDTIGYDEHEQAEKTSILKCPSSKKDTKKSLAQLRGAAATKGNEVHDTRKNAKAQVKRENAAATEANRTLEEAEAQEIERRSMKRSSTVANQRGVPARQDGWTSTPCVSDDTRKYSEYDKAAGERLQEQRPHSIEKMKDEAGAQEVEGGSTTSSSTNTRRRGIPALIEHRFQDNWTFSLCTCGGSGCSGGCDVLAGERLGDDHPDHNSEEHLGAQVPHHDEEAGSIVFHSSRNASEFKNDNNEARVTASAAAKVSEHLSTKDAEILRLVEVRRSTPKEEKQRLKELSKCIKMHQRKKE